MRNFEIKEAVREAVHGVEDGPAIGWSVGAVPTHGGPDEARNESVPVGGRQQVEAVGHLGAFGERPVGQQHLAVAHPDRRRRRGRVQRRPTKNVPAGRGVELGMLASTCLPLL